MAQIPDFRSIACVILGGVVGALAGLPAASMTTPPLSQLIGATAIALGFWTGYRRRKSAVFFYFALICATALALVTVAAGYRPQ